MTTLNTRKQETRFLLNSISGKFYNVFDQVEKKNIEFVGKRAFDKWAKGPKDLLRCSGSKDDLYWEVRLDLPLRLFS